MENTKESKRKIECEDFCKDQFIEGVFLGCRKCIKHKLIALTQLQKNKIAEIIEFNN